MKPRKALLFSALLNLGLVSAVVWVHSRQRQVPSAVHTTTRTNPATTNAVQTLRVVVVDAAPARFTWRSIQTNDYGQYIANLRGVGCPEETIRDIITADVNRSYTAKFAAERQQRMRNFKFWALDRQDDAELRRSELAEEKRRLLEELFGQDVAPESEQWFGRGGEQEAWWDFLPKDKAKRVRAINQKYRRMEFDIEGRPSDYPYGEREPALKRLSEQKQAELASLLTPKELEDLELRESPAAQYVRRRMPEPKSEEEFRAMFKLAKAWNKHPDRWNDFDPDLTPEARVQKSREQEKAVAEALTTALGEARYAEIARAKENERQQELSDAQAQGRLELLRLARQQGVSEEAANQAHTRLLEIINELEVKFGKPRGLLLEDQRALVKAWKLEAEKALVEIMGDKGHNVFKRFEQGREESPEQ